MLFLQIYKKGVLFFVETMNYSGEKENRGSPDKKEVCRNDADLKGPSLRHCSFRWMLFKR